METDDEIKKFKNLASIWWDEDGPTRSLYAMNSLRIPHILECLQKTGILKSDRINTKFPLTEISFLDIGCGAGYVSEALSELGGEVVGIDGVQEMIDVAKRHASSSDKSLSNLTYLEQTAEEFVQNNSKQFDVVLMLELLEHIVEHKALVELVVNCLRPGGAVFVSTLNTGLMSWMFCKIIPEYVLNFIPKGTHDVGKFVNLDEIKRLLEKNNCTVKSVKGLYYNCFRNYWFWWRTTSAFYFIYAVKD